MFDVIVESDVEKFVHTTLNNFVSRMSTYAMTIQYYCAHQHAESLRNAIFTEKYANRFPAYKPSYRKDKLRRVQHLRFWQLSLDVLRNIIVTRSAGKAYASGLVPGTRLSYYAYSVEEGLSKGSMGPRRLFRFTLKDFIREEWLKLVDHRKYTKSLWSLRGTTKSGRS